jgi:hypothetical protein
MSIIYDTVIIGAGPAGLAFANYAKKHKPNQSVLIIEKDRVIGGCHKVNRKKYQDSYYFCEHGPRVYIGNYVNFFSLLKSMNLNFNDLFIKKYSLFNIINKSVLKDQILSFMELLKLTRDFIIIIFDNKHGVNMSMYDYMKLNDFSDEAIKNIDFLCSSFDGGDSKKISLNSFISTTIQTLLYSTYVPRRPNDEVLFNYWQRFLEMKKVHFSLQTAVSEIIPKGDKIDMIVLNDGTKVKGTNYIFAIPPANLAGIKGSKEVFDITDDYVNATEYHEYISISFHWDYELKLEDDASVFNIKTEWQLIPYNMSALMKFKEIKSKTVVSCAVVNTNAKGRVINKTANECNEKELIDEVYEQLRLIYKNIPKPTLAFVNNEKRGDKWESNETAFIKVPNYDYLDFSSKKYRNIYCLGTHNGKQKNSFTSLESAISNSIKLANIIFNKKDKIKRCFDIRDLIIVIISTIILILLIKWKFS